MKNPFPIQTLRPWIYSLQILMNCIVGLFTTLAQITPPITPEMEMRRISVPKDFSLTLFAKEPLLLNPVALTMDESGRAFVVETHRYGKSIFDITQNLPWLTNDLSFRSVEERTQFLNQTFATNNAVLTADSEILRLVEDCDLDGAADKAKVFATGFNDVPTGTAAGVLARRGNVWFGNIPSLWLFREVGSNSISRKELLTGFGVHIGVTGHDLHGLTLGPDQRLYFSVGDRGARVISKENKLLEYPDTGVVFRCDLDGANLEVFCYGLRNPQDLTFDDHGNLWTADNDTAGADKSRLLYLVEGGDYGWRCSYQHQEGFGPWVKENLWMGKADGTLPHSGEAAQGPAGLVAYPGVGFPSRYKGTFFVCDFPGGIWNFKVIPEGAGFKISDREKFLWNLWPTDLDFGPNGSLFISDWVQGWVTPNKGRIYQVAPSTRDAAGKNEIETLSNTLKEGVANRSDHELISLLSHPDRRVRQEAHLEIAHRPYPALELLLNALEHSHSKLPRLHAIWAASLILRKQNVTNLSENPDKERLRSKICLKLESLVGDPDQEVASQAIQTLGDLKLTQYRKTVESVLQNPSVRTKFFALMALAKVGNRGTVKHLVSVAVSNQDRDGFLVHALVEALRFCATESQLHELSNNRSVHVRRMVLLVWRRNLNPNISKFLKDSDPGLRAESARAINDLPIPQSYGALAASLFPNEKDPTLQHRAINAHLRLGQTPNAQQLSDFARSKNQPLLSRLEAIKAFRDWSAPPPLDKVVGLWRPYSTGRDASLAKVAFKPILELLFTENTPELLIEVSKTAASLGMIDASADLAKAFNRLGSESQIRIALLNALSVIQAPELGAVLSSALESEDDGLRAEAIKVASRFTFPNLDTQMIHLFRTAPHNSVVLKQSILASLARLNTPAVTAFLGSSLESLARGEFQDSLRLDLVQSIETQGNQNFVTTLSQLRNKWSQGDFKESDFLLVGGNAELGRKIFEERVDVACLRCHQYKGRGGTVGPPIHGIGNRLTRNQILKSILNPNATIAQGFEQVTIQDHKDLDISGTLKLENENTLVIELPDGQQRSIPKSQVKAKTRGLSAMPENLPDMLTKRDLRDLVQFLSETKN